MAIPSLVIATGSELYAGISRQNAYFNWPGHSRNDNLLLTLQGEVSLTIDGQKYDIPSGELVYIVPGPSRRFQTSSEWEAVWVHFDIAECGTIRPEWGENSNCRVYHPMAKDRQVLNDVFMQICQLASERRIGWRRLAYLLISEVILRGNMYAGSCMETDHIELAAQLLSNPGSEMTMDEIAAQCGMSRASFYAKFRNTFGMSPQHYRENEMIRQCRYLLECTNMPIKQIAAQLNIDDAFYLSHRFRKWCGMSPTDYRKRFQNL